jgi:hypothetical protein
MRNEMSTQDYRTCLRLEDVRPPALFSSLSEISRYSKQQPYSHLMRRAWESLELDGVFCIEGKPVIYFKKAQVLSPSETADLHRRFWNQGIAVLLILDTPTEIQVFSGLEYPEKKDQTSRTQSGLVENLNKITDILQLQSMIRRVESGSYYSEHQSHFDASRAVDRYLMQNLHAARDAMVKGNGNVKLSGAHKLLGRIIFTCYLTERKIIGQKLFESIGARNCGSLQDMFDSFSTSQIRSLLSRLFSELRAYFNGNIFEEPGSLKPKPVTDTEIKILKGLLRGDSLATGQLSLGFWVYDFSIIPIETISAIYEDFLSAEGGDAQRNTGAYYTPKHLAEFVLDVAVEGWSTLLDKRYLDPACGSGVFLVTIFNRLAEEWRYHNQAATNLARGEALVKILQDQICGIDINDTACMISSLSLYLALLDQLDPRDIHDLKRRRGNVLPHLISKQDEESVVDRTSTIIHGNFFDIPESVANFDLVIGNPPWVSRRQHFDSSAQSWINRNRGLMTQDSNALGSAEEILAPLKQVAHLFMWKAPRHAKAGGRICLLLPTSVFLKRTDRFQREWFQKYEVDQLVQLADLRHQLFARSTSPSAVVMFRNSPPKKTGHNIRYLVPKASRRDPRLGIIEIQKDDERWVSLSELLDACDHGRSPQVWKIRNWGTGRDLKLLQRLANLPVLGELVGEPREGKRWIGSQGFQPHSVSGYESAPSSYGEPTERKWPSRTLYLDARVAFDIALLESQCEPIGERFRLLHRKRDDRIYTPPMILANKGFTKAALCTFPVLFQDSIYSIKGKPEDTELLAFATAVIRSSVARFFLFHTSTSWGIERDQIHPNEYKTIPFPLPRDTGSEGYAKSIVKKIVKGVLDTKGNLESNLLGRERILEDVRAELDDLVYDYFGFGPMERAVVHDTVEYIIPSIAPSSFASNVCLWRQASAKQLDLYVKMLCGVLNSWASGSPYRIHGDMYSSRIADATLIVISRTNREARVQPDIRIGDFDEALSRLQLALGNRNSRLSFRQTLKVFEKEHIYLIKPSLLRNWTETAALNDADELARLILLSPEE